MTCKITGQQKGAQRSGESSAAAYQKKRGGQVWVERTRRGRRSVYSVRYMDPWDGRRRRRTVGSSRQTAQRAARAQRAELAAIAADPGLASWSGWVAKDLAYLACYRRPRTCELAEQVYRQVERLCRPSHVGAVDAAMIEHYAGRRLAAGRSAATVCKELRTLQAGLARAVVRGYLGVNPFVGQRRRLYPSVRLQPVRTLTEAQFAAILAAAPRRDWRGILLLGYWAGLRAGEIMALQLADIDLAENLLWVRSRPESPTKSGESRAIPLAAPLRAWLTAVLAQRRRGGRLIRWTSLRPQRRERVRSLAGAFGRLCVRAGVVDEAGRAAVSLHDLRRTAITRWIGRGMSAERLKLRAGHKSLETTLRYYAAVDERRQDEEIVGGDVEGD